jgi:predicted P-loop ATPase
MATPKEQVTRREDDEAFDVSPEEEKMLLAALAQADRSEVDAWEELRERLRRFTHADRPAVRAMAT